MEEINLPIKTKIAAWWIRLIGILAFIFFIKLFFPPSRPEFMGGLIDLFALIIFGPILIIIGILFLKSSNLLFKKRKLGWWLSTITILPLGWFVLWFLMDLIEYLMLPSLIEDFMILPVLLFLIIPFILFLRDRKNFWKIAT